jgi:hypothetical protein
VEKWCSIRNGRKDLLGEIGGTVATLLY